MQVRMASIGEASSNEQDTGYVSSLSYMKLIFTLEDFFEMSVKASARFAPL